MKNMVKYQKEFFAHFNALETYGAFIESIYTLNKRVWIDSNLRVWINSIKGYGSTQDVIDGPHCMYELTPISLVGLRDLVKRSIHHNSGSEVSCQ